MHCLVVTDDGEVYCWGRNDQAQLGDNVTSSKSEPTVLTALEGKHISGVTCGPAQVRTIYHKLYSHAAFGLSFAFAMYLASIVFNGAWQILEESSQTLTIGVKWPKM